MSVRFGNQVSSRTSAVVLTVLLAACGGDSQNGKREIALATATPVVAEPVSTGPSPETSSPKLTNVTYTDAETVFRKGQYKEAAELFEVYVEKNPGNGFGQYMLGLSAWKSGDFGRAEKALTRAVDLDSTNVKAQTNLGRVLLEQGRPNDALPHIEKAVELAPNKPEVWRVLGNVKAELGMGEEAIQAYREALLINDQDAWSMNNYGLVLIKQGRYEEALMPLARAVQLVPTSPVFQNNLGIAFERSGYLGGARKAFEAAVDADSTYVKAKTSLERVQSLLGESEGEMVDVTALAQSFVEEIERWRTPQLNEVH